MLFGVKADGFEAFQFFDCALKRLEGIFQRIIDLKSAFLLIAAHSDSCGVGSYFPDSKQCHRNR